MGDRLEDVAARAARGDRRALEAVVRSLQDDVYRLSLRMLGAASDAQDASQEILIRVITHSGSFRGESSLRTWATRIATRHLLRSRKLPRASPTGFDEIAALIDSGGQAAPEPLDGDDAARLAEQVRASCTQAMLLGLRPAQRVVYILGDIFGLESREAAQVLGIEPAAFRKRLERARALLAGFMAAKCGLANPVAACRCVRQIPIALGRGLIDRAAPSVPRGWALQRAWDELSEIDRAARVFSERATELAPEAMLAEIQGLIRSPRFRLLAE